MPDNPKTNFTVIRGSASVNVNYDEDGKTLMFFAKDVRGCLVWPSVNHPGYYAIFALKQLINDNGKFPLVLLYEESNTKVSQLFRNCFLNARRYECREFYADKRRENEEIINLFQEVARFHANMQIDLLPARMVKNMEFGLNLIQEWHEAVALDLPADSVLALQLKSMTAESIGDDKYYAVDGLRYVVASLESAPWQAPQYFVMPGKPSPRADARGWT